MNERFAVLRTSLEPLSDETLNRAFRGIPGLTPFDVNVVVSEASSVVCRGFTAEQAAVLQANLKTEGVEVAVVEQSKLPVTPQGKTIRRVQITHEALMVEDLIKGLVPVAWDKVRFLAAASLKLATLTRQRKEHETMRLGAFHGLGGAILPMPRTQTEVEYSSKVTSDWHLRAEIILADATGRYSIEAEHFNFALLGEGVTKDVAADFCLLVRELVAHAPNAMLSRGAASIVSDPCEFVYYPRKNAFQDEITWMLWRAQQTAT